MGHQQEQPQPQKTRRYPIPLPRPEGLDSRGPRVGQRVPFGRMSSRRNHVPSGVPDPGRGPER